MIFLNNLARLLLILSFVPLVSSCLTNQRIDGPSSVLINAGNETQTQDSEIKASVDKQFPTESPEAAEAVIYHGTGKFIAAPLKGESKAQLDEQGDITLNFHNTDIHEVIKVVLGDILNLNYVVDSKAAGSVSLQTSKPVTRESILPMFESILQVNGLALVETSQGYKVLPYKDATNTSVPRVSKRIGPGFSIQVIPLAFISATEMQKILEPVVAKDAFLRVDNRRNLLMLAGNSQELENWLETIRLFDVDWLLGQSVGLFPLSNTNASDIINELNMILGAATDGVVPESVTIQPLERMNTLLVITSQRHYLKKIQQWIERLDLAGSYPGKGLYVYKVKNRKAVDLAAVINNVFTAGSTSSAKISKTAPKLAPGMKPVTLKSNTAGQANPAVSNQPIPLMFDSVDVRVVADEQKNAILIMASAEEYRIIESALKRLDTVPLQVIIEVSIIDVILTDDLKYGVEWYFKNTIDGKSGTGSLNFRNVAPSGVEGFVYSLVDSAGNFRAVLNALAEESKINVISSPSLMVLDNNTAEIQVGNQQPVRTATAETDAGTILETIEFKDTGVKLAVTPSVNPGGLVTMAVSQEVTDVGDIDIATGQRSFLKRLIDSTVAVKSGQTIVLGGLITENDTVSESGVPGLYQLPIVGNLFGTTNNSNTRNELLILLTPSVVEKPKDAAGILEGYRESMKNLKSHWLTGETSAE